MRATFRQMIFGLADIKKMIKENYKNMKDKETEEIYDLELCLMSEIMRYRR